MLPLGMKGAELGSRFRRHSVAEAVEPGTRVEVLASRGKLSENGLVGMSHNEQPNGVVVRQQPFGPRALPRRRPVQLRLIHRVVSQHWTQQVNQAQSHV